MEEVQREEACARVEKLEKARLRGNHALKKEQDTQVVPRSGKISEKIENYYWLKI